MLQPNKFLHENVLCQHQQHDQPQLQHHQWVQTKIPLLVLGRPHSRK